MPTRRRHHLNLLWVAFLALAGMASIGDVAKACAVAKTPKACCEASPAVDCHCCVTPVSPTPLIESARSEGIEWSAASPTHAARFDARPVSSCECRTNAPPAPAQKSAPRTTDQSRSDRGHNELAACLVYTPQLVPSAFRLVSANASPPKSPLYLRTLHLLV